MTSAGLCERVTVLPPARAPPITPGRSAALVMAESTECTVSSAALALLLAETAELERAGPTGLLGNGCWAPARDSSARSEVEKDMAESRLLC